MIKKIALALVALVAVFLLVASFQPAEFKLERKATMRAPVDVVMLLLTNFHAWGEWSPWEKLDPAMKRTFSGAPAGTGAVYAWAGDKSGSGRMEITSTTNSSVVMKLDFTAPFQATNTTLFTVIPQSPGVTEVTWTMTGHNNLMAKVFHMFMDMDKLVGKDFESGLAQMKQLAESKTPPPPAAAAVAAP